MLVVLFILEYCYSLEREGLGVIRVSGESIVTKQHIYLGRYSMEILLVWLALVAAEHNILVPITLRLGTCGHRICYLLFGIMAWKF